jgi:nitrite reductase/ring-hydroxylating ferredoxin subunit
MNKESWHELGDVATLQSKALQEVVVGHTRLAVTWVDGALSVISGLCNHVGGPLGQGTLEGDYVVCPWHQWRFHRLTGKGEPGYGEDAVPVYRTKIEDGRAYVDLASATTRHKAKHEPHALARPVERASGPVRVVGVSTTVMSREYPRASTSERLLEVALDEAKTQLGCAIAKASIPRVRALAPGPAR